MKLKWNIVVISEALIYFNTKIHGMNLLGLTQWRTGQVVSLPDGKWAPDEVGPLRVLDNMLKILMTF